MSPVVGCPKFGALLYFVKTFQQIFRSKKYILTLVPIFVVCPALGFAIFILRHKLIRLIKKCCGSNQVEEKDVSKVSSAKVYL